MEAYQHKVKLTFTPEQWKVIEVDYAYYESLVKMAYDFKKDEQFCNKLILNAFGLNK